MNNVKSAVKPLIALAGMIFALAASASAQAVDKRIDAIRKIYDETNSQIAEMEKHPDLSTVFVVELVVNKHLSSYPAVGIYQSAATFYYTFGDREKNPYPDRLLKISVEIRRSSRSEKGEFYFNAAGELVFTLVTNADAEVKESRVYFASGRPIKLTDDGKEINLKRQRADEAATRSKAEAARLRGIFRAAMTDN